MNPINPTMLPPEHELRNKPLKEIGVWVRNNRSGVWRDVREWKISKSTFNELGSVWLECNEWRILL